VKRRLFARATARFYSRHPWQLGLAVAGIALGVAVFVGVELANDSARRAFDLSGATIRGRTTHRLLPIGERIPENVYAGLVREGRVTAAAPVIEAVVTLGSPTGPEHRLLGIDPVEEIAFRDYTRFVPGERTSFEALISRPDTILVPASARNLAEAGTGAAIRLYAAGVEHRVEIVGTVEALGSNADSAPPVIADVSTAQELLGSFGVLDRIDLILTPEQAEDLRNSPPPRTSLVVAGTETLTLDEMTRAFRTNLTALGLLALVVGMFLVYSTISFTVVQRRATIGLLRALGAQRNEVVTGFLVESAVIGIVGTLFGLVLGNALAQGLLGLVLRTIGDLSFAAALGAAQPSIAVYVQGTVLGLGATLLAALVPTLEAARTTPHAALSRAGLERTSRARARIVAWSGAPLLALAGILLLADRQSLAFAFAALFCVLCAGAACVPAATAGFMRILAPAARSIGGLPLLMAVRGVTASLSRTGVATAALAVAVATVIGIGVMIMSFRSSLVAWLDTTLTADAYLSSAAPDALLADEQVALLTSLPEVRGVSQSRTERLPTRFGELPLRAATPGPDGWGLDFVAGTEREAEAALATSASVVVSEPLASRHSLAPGDVIELPTATGSLGFEIVGVFRDYSMAGSVIVMGLETYRQHWADNGLTGIGVHFARGVETSSGMEALRAALGEHADLRVRSTESIERLSLAVFDRTFEITEVLRFLAGCVAFLGVLSAALALELERSREHAILRSVGWSPRELRALILTQTSMLGLAAGLAAIPLGAALAALLVYVINQRSFGWSMDLVITPAPLALGAGLAVTAAFLAGIYPALRASRVSLDTALRDE
jgi:putative ABC transport system permease protein